MKTDGDDRLSFRLQLHTRLLNSRVIQVTKMSKITKLKQYEILVSYMEQNQDFAKGYNPTAEAKVASRNLWENIATECNAEGPPVRNAEGWKKVWSDYNFFIKKKLRENKKQQEGTGGGRNKQYSFSPLEEAVINLVDLRVAVDGISGSKTFGGDEEISHMISEILDDEPSTRERSRPLDENVPPSTATQKKMTPKARKREKTEKKYELLQNQTQIQKEIFEDVSRSLKSLKEQTKENTRMLRKLCGVEEERLKVEKRMLELKTEEIHMKKVKYTDSQRNVLQDLQLKKKKWNSCKNNLISNEAVNIWKIFLYVV